MFVERTWAKKTPGDAPHKWEFLPRFSTGEVPIDQQVNEWLEETGAKIVNVSPPGVYHYWLDTEYTHKCVTLSLTVVYEEAEVNEQESQNTDPACTAKAGGQEEEEEFQARPTRSEEEARQPQDSTGTGLAPSGRDTSP